MDRVYIDYEKFKELSLKGVIYVTWMKKSLNFSIKEDIMYQTPEGFMEVRILHVTFSKQKKSSNALTHDARIITYVDVHKRKLVSLLTNDLFSDSNEIIAIYRKRWEIELLLKQIKQNFPLKYYRTPILKNKVGVSLHPPYFLISIFGWF